MTPAPYIIGRKPRSIYFSPFYAPADNDNVPLRERVDLVRSFWRFMGWGMR